MNRMASMIHKGLWWVRVSAAALWFVLVSWGRPVTGPPCTCPSRWSCWWRHRWWSLRDIWSIGWGLAKATIRKKGERKP